MDWNGDATVDISDVVSMVGFLFAGNTPHALNLALAGPGCTATETCSDLCVLSP